METKKKMESEGGKLGQAFDATKDGPFDADFWFKMDTGLDSPRMNLPEPKDTLFAHLNSSRCVHKKNLLLNVLGRSYL